MNRSIIFIFIFIAFCSKSMAQTPTYPLYMPIEFQKAYQNGTRKLDGTVSPTYWQNRSEYKLKAQIDPLKKRLKGEATITYYNNSPDTLRRPTFHAYHDYYKKDSKKASFFSQGNEFPYTEGMEIGQISVEGEKVDLKDRRQANYGGTFYSLNLKKPLAPKSKIEIKVNWEYTIPSKGFERSGAIDSSSMFIAYWYPEMAVLDDINGWDRVLYDAATEFYHDYSDYEVEIEAPDNFVLWASVFPNNPTEVYSTEVQKRLEQARKTAENVSILTEADLNKKSSGKNITWKYTAKNFPDFAFALSDHFVWEAATYKDQFGEYLINSAYPPERKPFKTVLKTISESIKIFHNDFPAYPFPFKHFTVFNGLEGGGMEFPGMANDEAYSGEDYTKWTGVETNDFDANMGLTLHEMCHMYFPFMMGINEKKYAWMDEGWASFSSWFLKEQDFGGNGNNDYMGSQNMIPVMVPSHLQANSGVNSYTIGSYSYFALYRLLGKDLFKKSLKEYMDTWKYKHPTPYDYMFSFNRASGQDLNWFWKKWYFDWGYVDIAIKNFDKNTVVVENIGGRPMPFNIKMTYEDGTSSEEEIGTAVWKDSNSFTSTLRPAKPIAKIQLRIPHGSDANADNNVWTVKK